jgi:transposase
MPAGRPVKFTPELGAKIILGARYGHYRETVAAHNGVDPKTLRNWLKRGTKGGKANEPFRLFAQSLEQADAEAEMRTLEKIAASEKWEAHAWRLARRSRSRWGDTMAVRLELEGYLRDILKIAERVLPSALYEKLVEEYDSFLSGSGGTSSDTSEES